MGKGKQKVESEGVGGGGGGAVVVGRVLDFAENFTCTHQDEA